MKILLAGDLNTLTDNLLQRLKKEGNTVSLMCRQNAEHSFSSAQGFPCYEYHGSTDIHGIFQSVCPDSVIFAGEDFLDPQWNDRAQGNLPLLLSLLEEARSHAVSSFLLLSSTEVYGRQNREITEETLPQPDSQKGSLLLQQEKLLESYKENYNLPSIILRLGPVFGETLDPRCPQWLSGIRQEEAECWVQPICTRDVSDALVRLLAKDGSGIYNVCSTQPIRNSQVLKLLSGDENDFAEESSEPPRRLISNQKLTALQWHDLWPFEDFLREHRMQILSPEESSARKKKPFTPLTNFNAFAANMGLLILFSLLAYLGGAHPFFSQIHWLSIYVIIAALCFGLRQALIAGLLASLMAYVSAPGASSLALLPELLFFGGFAGYMVEELREQLRITKQQKEELSVSYKNLQTINHKNLYLKNEYENRLLQSKSTIPSLYSIISKINVLDTERIFVELLQVVKELIHTDTVAIYKASPNSSFLRLITSLNRESVMENRSWDITHLPRIQEIIANNGVYQGDVWKKEPAIVMSIPYKAGGSIVLVIKKVPMAQMSLYYINILRTLFMLVYDSIERASQYDSASRNLKYVEDTDILRPQEFLKVLDLAMEKKKLEVADCMLLKILGEDTPKEKYKRVVSSFRELDQFGVSRDGTLYVLLSNASGPDREAVLQRLSSRDVQAEVVSTMPAEDFT